MKHHTNISKYEGTMKELVNELSKLRYDSLGTFLKELAKKINTDSMNDHFNKKTKLAKKLHNCANELYKASDEIFKAWEICKPFMK